ncbi:MAG: polyphosphate polymerase domain-containing protein [Rikenellaceae bacterium]
MTNISEIISGFQGVALSEMDRVKLMSRTDSKYWFGEESLVKLLDEMSQYYYILEVCNMRLLPYETTYFDTVDNEMYSNHHRGKMNRYKIRKRNYVTTQSGFLEVKFKNNKGRTIKSRQPSDYHTLEFNQQEREFLRNNTPYSGEELRVSLKCHFSRITLVSKQFNERCTIDMDIKFQTSNSERELGNLVIVEVKRDGRSQSHIIDALTRHRLTASGFSKYCIGRSINEEYLKHNNFKQKHREIGKIVMKSSNNTELWRLNG